MRTTKPRRSLRVGLIMAVATAIADRGSIGPAAAAPLVDPNAVGSITVHKFEKPADPTGLPNDGTSVDTTGLTPLPGVTFKVQQVNTIALATNEGWADAAALSGVFDAANAEQSIIDAGYTLGSANAQITDTAGVASFTALPIGLYLVQETSYPAGVTPSAPFLITVPLTDPTDLDAWMYDVHVYPKNSTSTVDKTVEDSEQIKLGDPVVWTITADIPNEEVIDGYKIVDPLDSRLDYVSTSVTLADGTPLLSTDYVVSFDEATNTVTVQFTAAGLLVLADHTDTQVVVVINTTVNEIGEIENVAYVYPNEYSFDIEPGEPGGPTPTDPVDTKWGQITIEKVGENSETLSGAQFQVFTSLADAQAQTNPVVIDGVSVWTSDANGVLTIDGLRYSGWADGEAVRSPVPMASTSTTWSRSPHQMATSCWLSRSSSSSTPPRPTLRSTRRWSTFRPTVASSCPSPVELARQCSTWSVSLSWQAAPCSSLPSVEPTRPDLHRERELRSRSS